jgi:hypothetical protein
MILTNSASSLLSAYCHLLVEVSTTPRVSVAAPCLWGHSGLLDISDFISYRIHTHTTPASALQQIAALSNQLARSRETWSLPTPFLRPIATGGAPSCALHDYALAY